MSVSTTNQIPMMLARGFHPVAQNTPQTDSPVGRTAAGLSPLKRCWCRSTHSRPLPRWPQMRKGRSCARTSQNLTSQCPIIGWKTNPTRWESLGALNTMHMHVRALRHENDESPQIPIHHDRRSSQYFNFKLMQIHQAQQVTSTPGGHPLRG